MPNPFFPGRDVCVLFKTQLILADNSRASPRKSCFYALLSFYNSSLFAIITYLLALVLSSLDWKFPQGQASCLLVSCPARGQAHSRRGEHGTLGSGKSTAVSGCCLFMRRTFRTLTGGHRLSFSPLPGSKGEREDFFPLFPLEKKPSAQLSFEQQMWIFLPLKSIKVCPACKQAQFTQ